MPHECTQSDVIRRMELDIAVAKSDIQKVKDDIKDVKDDMKEIKTSQEKISIKLDKIFNQLTWWIIGLLVTITGTLAFLVYNNLLKG